MLDFIDEAIEKEVCSSMVLENVIAQFIQNRDESEEGFLRVFGVQTCGQLLQKVSQAQVRQLRLTQALKY